MMVYRTCTASIQTDDLERSVWTVATEIGTCAIWITVWTFETSYGILTVRVRKQGYLAYRESLMSKEDEAEDEAEHFRSERRERIATRVDEAGRGWTRLDNRAEWTFLYLPGKHQAEFR